LTRVRHDSSVVAPDDRSNYSHCQVQRLGDVKSVQDVGTARRLLYKLNEAGPFSNSDVRQLVKVAGQYDWQTRIVVQQLIDARLDIIQ